MKQKINFSDRILVGITGKTDKEWQDKLKEIEKFKIYKVALFLELFNKTQRKKIYKALLNSSIKKIPLVHIKDDMNKEELAFLTENFNSKYFTIHEDHFKYLKKWRGFYKNLFLELNIDNFVPKNVNMNKIGGFCIDFSHFKNALDRNLKEANFVLKRKRFKHLFACNHLF